MRRATARKARAVTLLSRSQLSLIRSLLAAVTIAWAPKRSGAKLAAHSVAQMAARDLLGDPVASASVR